MTKKALKAGIAIATEAYEEAQHAIYAGYRKKEDIYGRYFAALYAIEGMIGMLCDSDEKVEWTSITDKQHKHVRKLLKL